MGRVPRAPGACGRRGGGWARGLGALRPARPPGSAHRLFDAGNDRPRGGRGDPGHGLHDTDRDDQRVRVAGRLTAGRRGRTALRLQAGHLRAVRDDDGGGRRACRRGAGVIVTDLQGGCTHAAAFGALEGRTLEEAWALIEAALDAAGGYDVRPIDAPQSPEPICQQPRGTSWSAARSPGSRRQQPASHGS